jgi:hypothetical protein
MLLLWVWLGQPYCFDSFKDISGYDQIPWTYEQLQVFLCPTVDLGREFYDSYNSLSHSPRS